MMDAITTVFDFFQSNPVLKALGILLTAFPIAWLIKRIVHAFRHKLFFKTELQLDDQIAEVIENHTYPLAVLLAAQLIAHELISVIPSDSPRTIEAAKFISEALYVVLMLVATKAASQIVGSLIEWYFETLAKKNDSKELVTIGPLVRKTSSIIVFLLASMLVLDHFSVNIGSLVVSLGVGSLAVALAAQDTIANIIAGFIIALDRPFRVGDRVRLVDGTLGDIYQLGLRSTKIKDFDNNLIILPNIDLIKNRVVNFTYPDEPTRILIEFELNYGTNVDQVRDLVVGLAKSHPHLAEGKNVEVQFMEFRNSGIFLRLEAFVTDFTKKFYAEIGLRESIYKTLLENGIRFAYPQRMLHFSESSHPIRTVSESNGASKPETP